MSAPGAREAETMHAVAGFREIELPRWNGLRLIVPIDDPLDLRSVQIDDGEHVEHDVPRRADDADACRSEHPSSGRALRALPSQ